VKGIPKRFKLGPHEITVKVVSLAEMEEACRGHHDEAPWGLWDMGASTIYIRRVHKGFPPSMQLHTFWHEFMHAAFETLGYERLSHNEQLVDQMGMMLMQAHQTFSK
jgi:hypothetical protein